MTVAAAPPAPVARGPGHRARALRPHVEDAARVHPRDRAAARAERVDVDARQRDLARAHRLVAGEVRLAALEQRDVGAGAAHVEGDEVALAEQAGGVPASRDAARRAREHRARGQPHRVRDGGDAAVRLHDQHVALVAGLAQARAQAAQVAAQHRAHVGVHHGGAEALVLLDLREHVRGERHVGVGQEAREQLPGLALVARIAVGVQVADRDRADARRAQPADRRLRRGLRERRLHGAVEAHPLGHVEPPRARHQGHGRRHAEVVAVVLEALAHLDHVAVPRGGQHADLRALALEQRVGGHRGAVHDEPGVGQQPGRGRCRARRPAGRGRPSPRWTGPRAWRRTWRGSRAPRRPRRPDR